MNTMTLVSHHLCPYVQRAAIALSEKSVPFQRTYIDLADKPKWFSALSPLGKVPLLKISVDGEEHVIFESSAILEYLEDTQGTPLHPHEPLTRARHRAWIEFCSTLLNAIARLYNAKDDHTYQKEIEGIESMLGRLENELTTMNSGPLFAGEAFTLVDCVFAPVFRYFDAFESAANLQFTADKPRIRAWRQTLRDRPSVQNAVSPEYPELLTAFLINRQSCLSARITA